MFIRKPCFLCLNRRQPLTSTVIVLFLLSTRQFGVQAVPALPNGKSSKWKEISVIIFLSTHTPLTNYLNSTSLRRYTVSGSSLLYGDRRWNFRRSPRSEMSSAYSRIARVVVMKLRFMKSIVSVDSCCCGECCCSGPSFLPSFGMTEKGSQSESVNCQNWKCCYSKIKSLELPWMSSGSGFAFLLDLVVLSPEITIKTQNF